MCRATIVYTGDMFVFFRYLGNTSGLHLKNGLGLWMTLSLVCGGFFIIEGRPRPTTTKSYPSPAYSSTAARSQFRGLERTGSYPRPQRIGDIALTPQQLTRFAHPRRQKRKFVADRTYMWELPIRYTLDPTFKSERPVRFLCDSLLGTTKNRASYGGVGTPDMYLVSIGQLASERCWSFIGYKRENQEVSLAANCFEFGIILHELGHALGFWHEQSRPDRDQYVTVHSDNVDSEENLKNFDKALWGDVTTLTIPYDLGSIMHYGPYMYNRTNMATVTTNDQLMQHVIGQREALSFHDVKQANYAYCQSRCDNATLECYNDGYPDPVRQCAVCRCDQAFTGRNCARPARYTGMPCGGHRRAVPQPLRIQSPGFMRGYRPRQSCSWLIQGEEGTNVFVEIHKTPFSLRCGRGGRCGDYVEIRYQYNLALPGPRYCSCIPPGPSIKSSTNRILVFFKTQYGGRGGFRATYHSESCGGCSARHIGVQPPCKRYTLVNCTRRWRRQKRRKCHGWWLWRPMFCGYEYVVASRPDKCVTKTQYCCERFVLVDGRCKLAVQSPVVYTTRTPTVASTRMWTPWSRCSQSCGGCGSQTRRIICSSSTCTRRGGVERRSCNAAPCPRTIVYRCVKRLSYRALCNPWYRLKRYCIRFKAILTLCYSKCCKGFTLVGNRCNRSSG